jgi:hypothetical protein
LTSGNVFTSSTFPILAASAVTSQTPMSDLPTTGDLGENGPRPALIPQSGSSFPQVGKCPKSAVDLQI